MKRKMRLSPKFKTIAVISLILLIVGLYLLLIPWGYYETEYSKKPIVKEKIESGDLDYLYNFYITTTPNIENRPYFGDKESPYAIRAASPSSIDVAETLFTSL